MTTNSSRLPTVRDWIEAQHFRYRLQRSEENSHAVRLPCAASISCGFQPGRVFQIGRGQFEEFLVKCLGCAVDSETAFAFRFELDPSLPPTGFTATFEEGTAEIRSANECGLVDAMHYLERELMDRRGEFPPQSIRRHPTLTTRFTEAVFAPGHHGIEGYPDSVLGLMRHFGSNALRRQIDVADVWKSESLPELNAAGADVEIAHLQRDALRYADFGMQYFVIVNSKALPENHPVFENHPEFRGAREEIFLEETSGRGHHVLCSGHPVVREAYAEVLTHLFRSAPALAGAIVLVGGEGFHHCFMRPQGTELTNCSRCQTDEPHKHVANLVNMLAAAIKNTSPHVRLLAWPYGALTWSRSDATESRWIESLDSGVEVLSNFDCGDPNPHSDSGAVLFDYNIQIAGPSSRFAAQAARCCDFGVPILGRTETNTTPDTFFVPHIPVPFRWFERFRSLREVGCAGFMGQWFFYGMHGSIPEELQYHSVWNPDRSVEELLTTISRRDFQLSPQLARAAVEAWSDLSAAWDGFPYSAMTCGEREAYMRGPWYLGPAHPLVFNAQSTYSLDHRFFHRRGDLAESLNENERAALAGKPRYVCNLLYCLPFGVGQFLRLAETCRDQWDAGTRRLAAAIGDDPTPEARHELNVCRILSCHLHTLVNTTRFLALCDDLWRESSTMGQFEERGDRLRRILCDEIENAQSALPILEVDSTLGYGHNYGEVYDAEMVRSKIRQCEYVRDQEIPRIESIIRFHVWYRYP